jgi:hypothetical protein
VASDEQCSEESRWNRLGITIGVRRLRTLRQSIDRECTFAIWTLQRRANVFRTEIQQLTTKWARAVHQQIAFT